MLVIHLDNMIYNLKLMNDLVIFIFINVIFFFIRMLNLAYFLVEGKTVVTDTTDA